MSIVSCFIVNLLCYTFNIQNNGFQAPKGIKASFIFYISLQVHIIISCIYIWIFEEYLQGRNFLSQTMMISRSLQQLTYEPKSTNQFHKQFLFLQVMWLKQKTFKYSGPVLRSITSLPVILYSFFIFSKISSKLREKRIIINLKIGFKLWQEESFLGSTNSPIYFGGSQKNIILAGLNRTT